MNPSVLASRGAAIAAIAFFAFLPGCGGGGDSPTGPTIDSTSVATVIVAPADPSILVGATQAFTATAKNLQGKTLTSATFTWASSTTATATITGAGVATGVAAGSTTITATSGTISGTTSLTVTAPVISWVAKANMGTARSGLTTAVVNGIIYAIGGEDVHANSLAPNLPTVEAYDPATNLWTTKAPMPTARSFLASAVSNGIIYVFGGDNAVVTQSNSNSFNPVATVQAYDPATNTWTTKASMPIARERFAAVESNGIIYVMGGLIPDGTGFVTTSPTMYAYTPSTNTWSAAKAPMPSGQSFISASVLNGVIYVLGGQSSNLNQAYDIATNTWSTKTAMSLISGWNVSFTANSSVYAMSGFPSMEAYSPTANAWTAKSVRTGYTTRDYSSMSIVGTTMYSIGGNDQFSTFKILEARIIP
jgi:N-acetylneuraminic acid mutarotase